ncbi:MAG: hypothetical protein A3J83_04725 [Elusimicrobia bacterium RIFOXYA2_FULL_40_6]|nr:MAG: hypothetical protein A3J83_04725 [Elusimicrobia bacterium RIFOXYA2_FULL_40_6]
MNELNWVEQNRKKYFFSFIASILVIYLSIFGIVNIFTENHFIGIFALSVDSVIILMCLYFMITKNLALTNYVFVSLVAILFLYLLFSGGVNNTGCLWCYVYPLMTLFLLGYTGGLVLVSIFLFIVFMVFIVNWPINVTIYSFDFKFRFIGSFFAVSVISFFFEYLRDITQKKLIQESLLKEELKTQLLQSEKIAAVGQLAGGVAHEINNPLGVILGFSQILTKNLKENEPLYMPLKSIEREAVRCKKLIGDLLTFSRTGKTITESADINIVINGALSLVETKAKTSNIEVIRNYEAELPQITVNTNQIQQVIINLCNNAMDAMPEGGKITITTKKLEQEIEIEVSDTGTGMSEETKKHLFEPFFTTKEVGKGTGLGLSLVYEIVKKHNGAIELESEVGKGTAFIIKLPLNIER